MPNILAEATQEYLKSIQPEADSLLLEMEEQADEERIPIASREVSKLQTIMARSTGAQRVLEFGTAIGYTTIQIARTGCEVVTLEVDEERISDAREYIERAGVGNRIEIIKGEALDTLPRLKDRGDEFDMIFIDAVKEEYIDYLDRSYPMLKQNGIFVVDNLLWAGRVPDKSVDDETTEAIREFNEYFMDHDGIDSFISPLGDGTGIGIKV